MKAKNRVYRWYRGFMVNMMDMLHHEFAMQKPMADIKINLIPEN